MSSTSRPTNAELRAAALARRAANANKQIPVLPAAAKAAPSNPTEPALAAAPAPPARAVPKSRRNKVASVGAAPERAVPAPTPEPITEVPDPKPSAPAPAPMGAVFAAVGYRLYFIDVNGHFTTKEQSAVALRMNNFACPHGTPQPEETSTMVCASANINLCCWQVDSSSYSQVLEVLSRRHPKLDIEAHCNLCAIALGMDVNPASEDEDDGLPITSALLEGIAAGAGCPAVGTAAAQVAAPPPTRVSIVEVNLPEKQVPTSSETASALEPPSPSPISEPKVETLDTSPSWALPTRIPLSPAFALGAEAETPTQQFYLFSTAAAFAAALRDLAAHDWKPIKTSSKLVNSWFHQYTSPVPRAGDALSALAVCTPGSWPPVRVPTGVEHGGFLELREGEDGSVMLSLG